MNLLKLIEFLRARLKTVIWICCAVLVLLAAADIFLVSNDEAHTAVEHFPAFWSIFGFLGCAVIILVSKWFGHLGIMTREDYYEDESPTALEGSVVAAGVRPSSGAATSGSSKGSDHSSALDTSKPAAPANGRTPKEAHHE